MQASAVPISERSSLSPRSPIPIVPRRATFDHAQMDETFFVGGNSVLSAMFVVLSASFPPGEKEFILSVRNYMDRIDDPELKRNVKAFSAQEAQHSNQHAELNMKFDELGFPAAKVESFFVDYIDGRAAHWSHEERLATTVVMEHITATMANYWLKNEHRFPKMPEEFRKMMAWHSIEEIEHKSVAFDVYKEHVGDYRRLLRRLLIQMWMFPVVTRKIVKKSLKSMGHKPTLKERYEAIKFLWGRGGMITSMIPMYLAAAKRDFHPWDVDDSDLVESWKAKLEGEAY